MAREILPCRPSNLRLQSSPKIFDMLSEAICWILSNNYLIQLLDNFLVISPPNAIPAAHILTKQSLGSPSLHKKKKKKIQVSLPKEKIDRIILVSSTPLASPNCSNTNSSLGSGT
ncbi:Methylenetetrahydrofolate--tRNA-(uracil-5-)-methyltransferase TrmFO [Labeo rohita]|uniref:Methylenetetrahydrofolate--tRNA-(Uracil-5-)-methyltransferase TrmFO n=1 Tax=Labeo rohita TaxID=84645 RepID=A0ABQ8ML74_LABRO|nr:Methylenetetrahydrofolate--tRNA-(uracil-5-)-methyltransferase TrmFO [Labeo rohita]